MTTDQKLSSQKEEQRTSVISAADGDIEIFPDIPFLHLNKSEVKAYKAIGKNKIYENLVCYVCDKSLTPKHLSETKFLKLNNPNLIRLVASETVTWGNEGEKFCFFYEGPIGHPLVSPNDNSPALGWKPDEAMIQIVNPILSILSEMRDLDFVHGEIWPGNIHFEEEKSGKHMLLGDCLSLPQSYNLPFLYEPVERALADPVGKGVGTLADDLYSFGVSLAVILRTSDPLEGATKEEIIEHKIEKGTYATLIGKDRFNGAMLELLRGLLYDDAVQRWTLDDIMEWKDGRRLSPKQSTKRVKATRPIDFNKKKYTRPELLAQDLREKPSEATRIVEDGDLEIWIDRAIEDKTIKHRNEQMMKYLNSVDRGFSYNDQLASILAFSLYPDCPIRYKNISFHLSGFGKYFTNSYCKKEDIQPFADVLKNGLLIQISQNIKLNPALSSLKGKFDAGRNYLSQSLLGSGIERVLYSFNPESHCLSPNLENFYVRTPEEMMVAFETLCKGNPNAILFDRHTVAFLSLKDKKNIDAYLPDLRSKEIHLRVLGQLRVLATIQKRSNLPSFPNIANWVSSSLNQVYEKFHDAQKKERFKKKVNQIKKNGDLTKIATLFDDPKLYQSDIGNFYQAMDYYRQLDKEKEILEEKLSKKRIGENRGHQMSSLISMLLSLLIVLMISYFKFIVG
jgi:hypothetical protein